MSCGCTDNKINKNEINDKTLSLDDTNNKTLSLDDTSNMSIDDIIKLYQEGYRIETMQYSTYCTGSVVQDRSISDSSSNTANLNIYTAYAQKVMPTSKCLKNIVLKLKRVLDIDVFVEIRPHNTSTGFPQGDPQTSGSLGSYRISYSSIPTSFTDITVPLDILLTDTNVTNGVWIVVSLWIYDPSVPDATVYTVVGNGVSGTVSEHMAFKDSTLPWQGSNNWNLYFKTNKQTYGIPITCSVSGYWLVNGSPITGVNCGAGLTDTISVRCVATFSASAIGNQFKCGMQIKKPDGLYISKITSFETITGTTHNFTLELGYILGTSISPGLYQTGQADIYSFVIYDSNMLDICKGTGTGSGNCENLTVLSCSEPSVSVACPSSVTQGSTGSILATIGTPSGTSPYVYKLYRDAEGTPIATYPTTGTTTNISHLFSHTFSESVASHTFRVDVTDSCVTPGPKTGSGNCTVVIQSTGTCTAPVVSVTCPTALAQGLIADIVATITTAGTSPYIYRLYRDAESTPIDIYPTSGTTTNATHTFHHTLIESTTAHAFKVEVTDSCTSGGLIGVDICSITVQQPGVTPTAGIGTGVLIIAVAGAAVLALTMRKKPKI